MIQQVAFVVPDKIVPQLLSGELIQYGGVIRDTAGRIVMHLKPATIQQAAEQSASIAARVANYVKNNKNVVVVVGATVAAAAIVGGVALYQHVQKKNNEAVLFTDLNAALADYMDAIDKGELDAEKLDHAIDAVDAIVEKLGGKDVKIEIKGDAFAGLVGTIRDYTRLLCEANAAALADKVVEMPERVDGTLENLRDYLTAQRNVFELTA